MIPFNVRAICLKGTSNYLLHGVQSSNLNEETATADYLDIGRLQRQNYSIKPKIVASIEKYVSNYRIADGFFTSITTDRNCYSETFSINQIASFTGYTSPDSAYKQNHLIKRMGHTIDNDGVKSATELKEFSLIYYVGKSGRNKISDLPASDTKVLDRYILEYCLLKNIAYSISTGSQLRESLTFETKAIQHTSNVDLDIGSISPVSLNSVGATIIRPKHFDIVNTVLPSHVSSLTLLGEYKNGQQISGITEISASLAIDHSQILDVGQWRGSNAAFDEMNNWTTINVPLSIECNFKIRARRSFMDSILVDFDNFAYERIVIVFKVPDYDTPSTIRYYVIDLGNKNKLSHISESGGDTSGDFMFYDLNYRNTNSDFTTYTTTTLSDIESVKQVNEKI